MSWLDSNPDTAKALKAIEWLNVPDNVAPILALQADLAIQGLDLANEILWAVPIELPSEAAAFGLRLVHVPGVNGLIVRPKP